MKILILTSLVSVAIGLMSSARAAEDITSVPYEKIGPALQAIAPTMINKVAYVPFYLQHKKDNVILDPKLANFRIRLKDGSKIPLKCDTLAEIPKIELTEFEILALRDGSTHRLWIPGIQKKYAGSEIQWNLPKGALRIDAGQLTVGKKPAKKVGDASNHPPLRETLQSAERGVASAQYNLGQMYRLGLGVGKDNSKAEQWLRKAAEKDLPEAQYELSKHLLKMSRRGLSYFSRDGKSPEALKRKTDPESLKKEAIRDQWMARAAENGHAEAQYELAQISSHQKDNAKVLIWTSKAAEQGHMWAQRDLGLMYAQGEGTEKNLAMATQWLRKAAGHGDKITESDFGRRLRDGRFVIKDQVEAVKWLQLAADKGESFAQMALAEMYATGEGVTKDLAVAYMWYGLAKPTGKSGKKMSDLLDKEMTPTQIAAGKKMIREWVKEPSKMFWKFPNKGPFIR